MSTEPIDPKITQIYLSKPLPSVSSETAHTIPQASSSSIERMKESEKEHILDPAVPGLPLPFQFSFIPISETKDKILERLSEVESQAVKIIVEEWSKNIQFEAEAQKKDWERRIHNGLHRMQEMISPSKGKESVAETDLTGPAIFSAILILAPITTGALSGIGSTTASSVPGQILIHDVSNMVVGMESIVPDMRDMLGYLGALVSSTLFVQSIRTNLTEAGIGRTAKEFDLKFIKKYSAQMIGLITHPNFEQIMTLFLPPEKLAILKTMDRKEQLKFFAMLKVELLMLTIGFISKVEFGHIIGLDLKGMVDGITQLDKDDPRIALIEQFKREISVLEPNEQAALKELLYAYFDKGVKEKDIILPGHVLHAAAAFGEK